MVIETIILELKRYLEFLERQYGWRMRIHNIEKIAGKFAPLLSEFSAHHNPYCRYLKSEDAAWKACLQGKEKVLKKSEKGIFYGRCHGGVGEFILPVFSNKQAVGFLSVGEFRDAAEDTEQIFKRLTSKFNLLPEIVEELYKSSLNAYVPNLDFVETIAAPCARMLEFICLLQTQLMDRQKMQWHSSRSAMNYRIRNYIHHFYNKKISVRQIAEFCSCSESYIHHLFSGMNGMGIRAYINTYRVEQSKYLLKTTDRPIKEIAFDVGYGEYSYYANVFKKYCGCSPGAFRKKYKEKG